VVGVDEEGRLYWYHPDPDTHGAAVAIARASDARELPEAIRHHYRGQRLSVLGIFGDASLSAAAVAQRLDRSGCAGLRARLPGIACVAVELRVTAEAPR
jgi:hypothetical protein